jgi:di/tricarboxylate transporter
MQIAIVFGLLVAAIVLFSMERISVDIITLMLLIGLIVSGILTPEEAFSGFSNDIIIILVSIFILSGSLQQSGIMDAVGARLYQIAGGSTNRLMLALMTIVAAIAGFMHSTTTTAIFIPPTLGVARKLEVSPSKLLIPVAYASILGGTCTMVGTSTNMAVNAFISKSGMTPLSLFEITPLGLILLGCGIVYMLVVGKRLLPDHRDESLTEEYAIRQYLSEIVVAPRSHLIGQRVFKSDLARMEFRILALIRGRAKLLPSARSLIEEGDVLLVKGKAEDLMKVKEAAGIEIKADVKLSDPDLQSEDIRLAEVMIMPRSDLIGRTLKEINFRQRFGMVTLAIHRHRQSLSAKIGDLRFRMGDVLLVQGSTERLNNLRRSTDLWILEELSPAFYSKRKGLYTVSFFAAAILVGGIGWLPLSVSLLAAAVLTILSRSITVEEAYEYIDWRLVVLIAGMTSFGTAMQKTGAAELLAKWIVAGLEPYGITVILAGFFVLTCLLTQPMSNAAAALVMLPIALHTAQRLGVNERTFAVVIMLAASMSTVAPFEPACILVYTPGKYKLLDFVKVGVGLTIVLMVIALSLIPVFWPLHPLPEHGADARDQSRTVAGIGANQLATPHATDRGSSIRVTSNHGNTARPFSSLDCGLLQYVIN